MQPKIVAGTACRHGRLQAYARRRSWLSTTSAAPHPRRVRFTSISRCCSSFSSCSPGGRPCGRRPIIPAPTRCRGIRNRRPRRRRSRRQNSQSISCPARGRQQCICAASADRLWPLTITRSEPGAPAVRMFLPPRCSCASAFLYKPGFGRAFFFGKSLAPRRSWQPRLSADAHRPGRARLFARACDSRDPASAHA